MSTSNFTLRSRIFHRLGQQFGQRRPVFEQRFGVDLILIGLAVFPATKQDSDPLVCECTNCGVVTLAALPEKFVMRLGPLAPTTRMIGDFLKRLSHEFRTGISPMHEILLFPALLGNGAIPAICCMSVAAWNRSRSVPNAAVRRGANAAPAPGKLSKMRRSGCLRKIAAIFRSKSAMLANTGLNCRTKACTIRALDSSIASSSVRARAP